MVDPSNFHQADILALVILSTLASPSTYNNLDMDHSMDHTHSQAMDQDTVTTHSPVPTHNLHTVT